MNRWIFFSMVIFLAACQPKLKSRFVEVSDFEVRSLEEKKGADRNPCHSYLNYAPDPDHLKHTPIKYIRVNFHYMNSSDSSQTYPEEKARKWMKSVFDAANFYTWNNQKAKLPEGNDTSVLPLRYRYVLTPATDDPDDDGMYFHYDDEAYFMVKKGRNSNLYSDLAFQRYGLMKDTVLNVFFQTHHPDSVASETYTGYQMGVGLGKFIKIVCLFNQDDNVDPWNTRGLFNHEVGHIYGLSHAWAYDDGCDDTPKHSIDIPSNNMMDYNSFQLSVTPCQIGKVQWRMATLSAHARKFLIPNWCQLDTSKTLRINDSIVWMSQKDLEGNLVIEKGGNLRVGCRLSIPPGGKIILEPGGTLILDNCRIHQSCGESWEGIEIQELGKEKGKLIQEGKVQLEDMVNSVDSPTPEE